MKTWIVEPRDTLVIRDGRPIQEGAPRMQSVDFPWPSTIAGFVRTRVGMNERGEFTLKPKDAREIEVHGPWLVELDDDGRVVDHYVPAPQDCIWHKGEDAKGKPMVERRRLAPIPVAEMNGATTDLDSGLQLVKCVCVKELPKDQKPTNGPAFWKWGDVLEWLSKAQDFSQMTTQFGHKAPIHERRFHVAIDETTQTAKDEHLFSTDGLRFSTLEPARKRLAVAFRCDDKRLREGLAMVGGERRISFLREAKEQKMPALPANFKLGNERIARVVLVTPALFANGFAPDSFGKGTKVIAAVVGRPQVISGWDFETNKPKATRRMAPAGSVYWVKLDPTVNVKTWAEGIWMKSVSDKKQDKLDGFGLAVVGVG